MPVGYLILFSTTNGTSVDICSDCALGTYQNDAGSTACKACDRGTFQDAKGQTFCEICNEGTYQNEAIVLVNSAPQVFTQIWVLLNAYSAPFPRIVQVVARCAPFAEKVSISTLVKVYKTLGLLFGMPELRS